MEYSASVEWQLMALLRPFLNSELGPFPEVRSTVRTGPSPIVESVLPNGDASPMGETGLPFFAKMPEVEGRGCYVPLMLRQARHEKRGDYA